MTEEEKKTTEETTPEAPVEAPKEAAQVTAAAKPAQDRNGQRGGGGGRQDDRRGGGGGRGGNRQGGGRGRNNRREQTDEFDSRIIDLARVTRVMAGGKRMSFRACVLVGDKKGRIGMGVKKGADVQLAVAKATAYAKKHLIQIQTTNGTIPHRVEKKFKGARVLLKPAKAGTGIIAGGPVRVVMELSGITNIVAKIKGSGNKVNNLAAVVDALESLVSKEEIATIKKAE